MSRIKIKNFGPIKEGLLENEGWIDIKKVTVFIGNQGSGKSTVAKLISTFSWIEKALNRGDLDAKKFTVAALLNLLKYQRINNYFKRDKTLIEYEGDAFHITYSSNNSFPVIKKSNTKVDYNVPKIMYVPAERSFLSSVSDAFNVKGLPPTLFTFAEELKKSQRNLKDKSIVLPINNYSYKYDSDNDISFVVGADHQVNLLEASSGFQSTIPLFLVTRYLSFELKDEDIDVDKINVNNSIRMNNEITRIALDNNKTPDEKNALIIEVKNKYINKCLINIVEEPEQNLFPSSQQQILNSLLEFNNMNEGNKLIITTHSPYLINYLSIAIQGAYLLSEINKIGHLQEPEIKIDQIVPINSTVGGSDVVVYQLDEKTGSISRLGNTEGIPSDKNLLNQSIRHGNELFDSLLEIEEAL